MALLFAVIAMNLQATRAMARLREWPGLADWMSRVAAAVPADARMFCDQTGFAAPLRFLFGKQAYELQLSERDPKRREALAAVMSAAAKRGEKVFLLTMSGPISGAEAAASSLLERGKFPLQSRRMETSKREVPQTSKAAGGDFVLYEIRRR